MQTDGEVIDDINHIEIEKVANHNFIAFDKRTFKNQIAKKYHSN